MSRADLFRKVWDLCCDTVDATDIAAIDETFIVIRCRAGKVLILIPRAGSNAPAKLERAYLRLSIEGYRVEIVRSLSRTEALLDEHYERDLSGLRGLMNTPAPWETIEMSRVSPMVPVQLPRSTYPILKGGEPGCRPESHPMRRAAA